GGVELSPGTAANLPITVRNDGGSTSEPVAVALALPRGVRAVGTGGGGGAAARAQAPGPISVNCPGGEGTVTCRTGAGLQPGQSATLTFRLEAGDDAEGGTVGVSVTAGVQVSVKVNVKVTVKPPPDGVVLEAHTDPISMFPWFPHPRLYVTVHNTGETTKPVTVTFDHPLKQWWSLRGFPCTSTATGASCTTKSALAPGQHVNLWVQLNGRPNDSRATVDAQLGRATAPPVTVDFGCWRHWCGQDPLPTTTTPSSPKPTPSKPKPTPSKPKPPVTTTEESSSTPPVSTTTTSAPPRSGGHPGAKPPTVSPETGLRRLTG
ncbi:MAG TPA: RNA polymerase subunit sigma, partial [Amycolatopsis sp.]|nr:RNA polymerase subunit sigma [Amycolatopsis sp.]